MEKAVIIIATYTGDFVGNNPTDSFDGKIREVTKEQKIKNQDIIGKSKENDLYYKTENGKWVKIEPKETEFSEKKTKNEKDIQPVPSKNIYTSIDWNGGGPDRTEIDLTLPKNNSLTVIPTNVDNYIYDYKLNGSGEKAIYFNADDKLDNMQYYIGLNNNVFYFSVDISPN